MIREPYGINPYNTTRDLKQENTFSFAFSGDNMQRCKFEIFPLNATNDTALYTSSVFENPNIYNDDFMEMVVSNTGSFSGGSNGRDLTWRIKMWENNAKLVVATGTLTEDATGKTIINVSTTVSSALASVWNKANSYYNLAINGEQHKITSYSSGQLIINAPFATQCFAGTNFAIYGTHSGSNMAPLATIVVGQGRTRAKPEDIAGVTYPAIDATHVYIEPTLQLRQGYTLTSYAGYTFNLSTINGTKTVNISNYDYQTSLLTLAAGINPIPTVGQDYWVKNANGSIVAKGTLKNKLEDIAKVTYPAVSGTQFYIGQHPKFATFKTTETGDYATITINNVVYQISSYDYDLGLIKTTTAVPRASYRPGNDYVIKMNYYISSNYFFRSRTTPSVSIVGLSSGTDGTTLSRKNVTFTGSYNQVEGDIIKYHYWTIKNRNTNEIDYQSEPIFSSELILSYNNFINEQQYDITLTVVTENDVMVSHTYLINVKYDEKTLRLFPQAVPDNTNNSIEIWWRANQYSNPKTNLTEEDLTDDIFKTNPKRDGVYTGNDGYLRYDDVSEHQLSVSTEDFTFNSFLGLDTTKEGDFITWGSGTYENAQHKVSLRKHLGSIEVVVDGKVIHKQEIFPEKLGVDAEREEEVFYVWKEKDNTDQWEDVKKWLETDPTLFDKYQFKIFALPDRILLYKSENLGEPELVLDCPMGWPMDEINWFEYGSGVKLDYILLLTKTFGRGTNEFNKMLDPLYTPSWDDFDLDTLILCDYKDSLSSSSTELIAEQIQSYLIYRCEVDKAGEIISEKFVGTYYPLNHEENNHIWDYSAINLHDYIYKLYPTTSNTVAAYVKTNIVKPRWEFWTFTEVVFNSEENNYNVVSDSWQLRLNPTPGAMSVNTGRVIHNNLSKYPKSTLGPQRYISQAFSALLGNFNISTSPLTINGDDLNGREFLDTDTRIRKWLDFINTSNPILVQTPKGLRYLAVITDNSISIDENFDNPLTSVSFTLTQIGDLDTYQAFLF